MNMKNPTMTFLISSLFFIFPVITLAAPVYLNCQISTVSVSENGLGEVMDDVMGSKNTFSVKLDEASGKIMHTSEGKTYSDYKQFKDEGFFSVSNISYKNKYRKGDGVITDFYEIDRTDLSVKMTSQLNVFGVEIENLSKAGTCKVAKTKKNKI